MTDPRSAFTSLTRAGLAALACLLLLSGLALPPKTAAKPRKSAQAAKSTAKPAAKKASPKTAPKAEAKAAPKPPTLQEFAEKLADRPGLTTGRMGLRVVSLATGKVLADVDGGKLFLPASNMKLYTTATALDVLGPEFRTRTSVYAPTPDAAGTVTGDLILYGRGDPNLSDRFNEKKGDTTLTPLEQLADQVAAAGIKRITGDVVGDESFFRAAPLGNGWEWNDLQWSYGTQVSALSAADNQIRVSLRPGARAGEPCQVTIFPQTSIVTIVNRTTTYAGKGDRKVGVHRGLADNTIEVWGALPVGDEGASMWMAIHDPALFTASLFKPMLEKRGIVVDGRVRRVDANFRETTPLDTTALKEVAFIESHTVAEMIRVVNKVSQNLHAETLLRLVGKLKGPQDKDADEAGTLVVADLLQRAGADPKKLRLSDGSGLSRLDNISPESTIALLSYMHRHPQAAVFLDSLPIAGVDGTLGGRMKGTKAEGNLRAKTGTLDDVSALSGYVTAANGDILAFSILMNNLNSDRSNGVAAGNELGAALARFGEETGGAAVAPDARKSGK